MSKPLFTLDASAVALVRRTLYAASRDDERPVLCAVRFSGDTVVATDSYRLACAYFDGEPLPDVTLDARAVKTALPWSGDWSPAKGEVPVPVGEYPTTQIRKLLRGLRWTCSATVGES